MKVMVNATNLRIGGGVQKAVQFYLACSQYGHRHNWNFILSPQIIASLDLPKAPPWINVVEAVHTPAKIIAGRATRRLLKSEEASFKPDVVFSISGPCYHRFRRPHLMGFAIGWITHPSKLAWSCLNSNREKMMFFLRLKYYSFFSRFADEWLFQTETAANGFAEKFCVDTIRTHVVPNSCSDFFFRARDKKSDDGETNHLLSSDTFRLLVITSYKAHKNIESIPKVAAILKEAMLSKKFHFVFTLDENSLPWKRIQASAQYFSVEECVSTVGKTQVKDAPNLFENCNAVFLPTLLETFSATYPEAMCMELPIITSDLDFARDICGNAAKYFNPIDSESAALAIREVAFDGEYRKILIENGLRQLQKFGTGQDRFVAVERILEEMAHNHAINKLPKVGIT